MRIAISAVLSTALLCAALVAADSWEKPRTFEASEVLTPEERKGEHHEVRDHVSVQENYYAFELETEFGTVHPVGLDALRKRIQETEALEALNEVSKSEVFLDAAGRSLKSMGDGIVHLAQEPEATAKGLGKGVKRFGMNLGRKTKRAFGGLTDDDDEEEAEEEESTGEEVESVANAALGVNKAARVWAEKLDADPYTRNPILQKALIEVAQLDRAAGIATKVVVPIPTVVGATNKVAGLVWKQDPEALRKTNEAALAAIGAPKEVAEELFQNEEFTITDQTRFATSLAAVEAKGLDDYVDTAAKAETARGVVFFVESAEMLERQHGQTPVTAVLTDSRSMVALSGGRAVLLLPLDYVAWTEHVAEVMGELTQRSRKELGAVGLEMQVFGRVSPRARIELQRLGWAVREDVPGTSPFTR